MDKNQAVIDYLLTCDGIRDSTLYFNFVNAKDGAIQFLPLSSDRSVQKPYIDGSVEKRYQITIQDFRSISDNPLVKSFTTNENVADFQDVQTLIDWINEQNEIRRFPDFGEDCVIDSIAATSDTPRLDQIDATVSPALARYSITITINYLDISKRNWK